MRRPSQDELRRRWDGHPVLASTLYGVVLGLGLLLFVLNDYPATGNAGQLLTFVTAGIGGGVIFYLLITRKRNRGAGAPPRR